ncbi:hypothetical protein ACFLXV_00030 [Chloroflexota bacterium]
MARQQIILLIINIIGGAAVIGSYVYGLLTHPGSVIALWGGVPESVRLVYGVSMVIAALGYLSFMYLILFRLIPADVKISGRFNFNLFYVIFLGVLIPSALWMPLTYELIDNYSTGIWIGVRTVLIIVGLSSCALVWALMSIKNRKPGLPYWFAIAGSSYFAFHTAVLDMLLWPELFQT